MPDPVGLLESFLPRDRCYALATGGSVPVRSDGAALFADISGFTVLSETMATTFGPRRGAEELTRVLNTVYARLIDDVTRRGGVVLYLSGDAITCWFEGDDGGAAVRSALDQQATMRALADELPLPGGLTLALKVAVTVGEAHRFVVGDPEAQLIDILAGPIVDRLAAAEGMAERGEVVVDDTVLAPLGERLAIGDRREHAESGRTIATVTDLVEGRAVTEAVPPVELPVDLARAWLAPDIFDRLVSGGDLFLAELRNAYPIFVRFGGFDFAHGGVVRVLDEFVRAVQALLAQVDGNLLGITVGDKGAYLYAVVGTPRTHEDDAARAVAAAVAIRDLEGRTAATGIQVGVSVGQVYSGTYGSPVRRTMSVLGDPVNLAARLMTAAPSGGVFVHGPVADAVAERYEWDDLPPLKLKGKSEPVRARSARGARTRRPQRVRRYPLPMVGRDRELAVVRDALAASAEGHRRIITISADPGLGKSRFVAEVLRDADAIGLPVAFGQGESMARSTSYFPWRTSCRAILGLDRELDRQLDDRDDDRDDRDLAAELERVLAAIDPALLPRLPLLGAVLGVELPTTDLVRALDAKLRKSSLENLLGDVLTDRVRTGPMLVVLDDLHWADPLSIDLLEALVRRTAGRGAAFLLAHRPEGDAMLPESVASNADRVAIDLRELDGDGMRSVVGASCRQVFGAAVAIAPALLDLFLDRAQGNPFYAEELIRYVERTGLDPADPATAASLQLPDSLQAVVLSRVDGLDERPRQAVKVASVVGREFRASLVADAHDGLGDVRSVVGHLAPAQAVDLVVPEHDDRENWLFRHAIIRDVAYESLPYGLRAPLHERVGDAIARRDGTGPRLTEIADHYWSSGNVDKQRHYLRLAGDAARESYANAAAIQHYERLATVVEGEPRARALLDLSGVLELVGAWERAEHVSSDARAIAESLGDAALTGWCDVSIAEIARKQGRYDEAVERLQRAEATFAAHDDEAGAARSLHLQGTVAAQQGNLDGALALYERSRAIRERIDDTAGLAAILSNLGVVANYQGDYDAARAHHRRSLELRTELGDLGAIAVSHTNLGILAVGQQQYAEAYDLFEEGMRLSASVGDAWMVAIAHNNIGNALRGLGRFDEARLHYAEAIVAYRDYQDRWALAFLLEDLAVLAALDGDPPTALELLGAADTMRDAIDARRPDSQTEELDGWIGPHLAGWEHAVESLRAAGRALTEDVAVTRATAYCRGT